VRLESGADDVLKSARTNAANSRMVVYGVCDGIGDARPFSKYGINALLILPLDRREALKAIKGSHLLVLHEFRRYVRIPLAVEVTVITSGSSIKAASEEISGGGMSLKMNVALRIGDPLEVVLSLPDGPAVKIPAVVRWNKQGEQLVGVRFEDEDARAKVKNWIDKYLGFS
jgi:PilZ domain